MSQTPTRERRTVLSTRDAIRRFQLDAAATLQARTYRSDAVIVKFSEELRARFDRKRELVVRVGTQVSEAPAVLARRRVEALFERSPSDLESERAELRAQNPRVELADLANYYRVYCADRDDCLRVLRSLDRDPRVECAYPEFAAQAHAPAWTSSLSYAQDRKIASTQRPRAPAPLVTPGFEDRQAWRGAAPDGLGAASTHAVIGAQGRPGQTIVQIEASWILGHEDVPDLVASKVLGPRVFGSWDTKGWRDHGSAAVGILSAARNAFGVRGLVPSSQLRVSSVVNGSGNAVSRATKIAGPGDVFSSSLVYAVTLGKQGFHAPFDYPQDVYDAIRIAVAKGIVVTIAAGNTGRDLANQALYGSRYAPWASPSGAWIVGATFGKDQKKAAWSNYGDRVRFSAWGANVATVGYGQLFESAQTPERRSYTDVFGGSSAASPQVAGIAAALQSAVWENERRVLSVDEVARALEQSATPIRGRVGPRPNLAGALRARGVLGELVLEGEAMRASTATLRLRAQSGRAFAILLSAQPSFVKSPAFARPLLLDPRSIFAVFSGVLAANGEVRIPLRIPQRSSITNTSAFAQCLLLPSSSAERSTLSNAVEMWIREPLRP